MILIYESTEINFDHMGLGGLVPLACAANEEINEKYELEMSHPIDNGIRGFGRHAGTETHGLRSFS